MSPIASLFTFTISPALSIPIGTAEKISLICALLMKKDEI